MLLGADVGVAMLALVKCSESTAMLDERAEGDGAPKEFPRPSSSSPSDAVGWPSEVDATNGSGDEGFTLKT